MTDNQLQLLTIAEQASRIRSKELSPVELIQSYIETIEDREPYVQAFVTLTLEQAVHHAKIAEKEIMKGNYLGPLHGIPYGVKDIIWTKGIKTTGGSNVFPDFVPLEDAAVVQRLSDAGAIVIGKTTTTEFAYQGGEPPTRNPWNLKLTPGGSSSGSAAAVSASMSSFSLGTQTYGSLIRPASYNGLTCMKPTFGRVSRQGVYIASWSLDHIGAFTRTVEDQALVLEAICGSDYRDPHSIFEETVSYSDYSKKSAAGMTIGIPDSYFIAEDIEIQQAFDESINVLISLGINVVKVKIPEMIEVADAAHKMVMRAEGAEYHAEHYEDKRLSYGPNMREQLELGHEMKAVDYIRAQRVRTLFRQQMMEMFDSIDVLLTPATVHLPKAGYKTGNPRFNGPFTNSGLPAMTIPAGFDEQRGVPIGIQFVAACNREDQLLKVGSAFQQVTKFHSRRANLSIEVAQ